ncbi:MAG: hypothetical protein KC680_04035 [Candidatus Peregrinibacteria bacterium]|nr:hypothetical protein [Candidatus Peregrinibacteria bacterium]MCB9808316.1 hypothetical protein [Candidatus Peribacteria bacterium]
MPTIVFIVIQAISVCIMLLFIHEYKRITLKHEQLLAAIEPGKKPSSTFQSNLIIWMYIIITIFIVLSTSTLLYIINYT